ncbi:Uncharacterized protein OS=Rivularia sp. PCC 7116 GN=Riv7116_6416 PE=4 SV=1 [Gemmata massiliana]|uniref:VWFA domain-containing protein n=1 Tax=Gemmata massiliana TaxID=1210884 RepID=A0A6P2D6X8_9BACT|nr:hypothetical protein [Gemmata massiliana]VTR96899.1 Uncharacterized protein OS=Rivularia sp. PCC 7116 GN=Riv7116_6416 PE=4 SV=1 [Gemmata massiliana]
MTMTKTEADLRLSMLNSLLTCPHRRLGLVHPLHTELVKQDPRFYVRLAAWYADHGDVRDHKEMFIVTLALSDFPGHRDTGLAMLRELPPYQVGRVIDFIHGRKEDVAIEVDRKPDDVPASAFRPKVDRKAARGKKPGKPKMAEGGTVTLTDTFGLFRNVPRSLKTEVVRYLREREADADWFDSTAITARKTLKRLYALLHVKPGPRAQAVLFDERPPEGSKLAGLKDLAKAETADEQAKLIAAHNVPFRVAIGLVKGATPKVLTALVGRMSPQEVINNLEMLRKRGAFDDAGVKALIESKLESAKTATRVSAFKAEKALESVPVSAAVRQKLEAVADSQVKARGRIARPTALLIDKSGSMSQAIEIGKRLGSLLAAVADKELFVYAFDSIAYPVESAGPELSAWERALTGITAGGNTSVGVGIDQLRRKKQFVEQIVIVTDEGENAEPRFVPALQKYREELKADPTVCFVKVSGATSQLEDECKKAGIAVDAYQFNGDYYALPNLVPLLARPSKLELLQEILEYPLPARRTE